MSLVLTPILSVVAALAVGAIIIAWAGDNPLEIYRIVFSEALLERTGWRDTLINATPLVLIGVGLAIAFRADVWNIGAEGQMMIGALCSIAVIGYVNGLPGAVLIPLGLLLGAVGGGLWGALAGWIHVRFGVNVVIATLLLVFVAEPLLTWAVRDPLKDPETFLPQSRVVGNAALPHLGWIDVHIGVLLVLVVVPVATWLMSSTRLGFVVRAHGGNRTATTANEVRPGRLPFALDRAERGARRDRRVRPTRRRAEPGRHRQRRRVRLHGDHRRRARAHQSRRRARLGARALGDARRRRSGAAGERAAGQPDADDPGADRRVRRRRRRAVGAGAGAARRRSSPSAPARGGSALEMP